jgi:hypothetical protein
MRHPIFPQGIWKVKNFQLLYLNNIARPRHINRFKMQVKKFVSQYFLGFCFSMYQIDFFQLTTASNGVGKRQQSTLVGMSGKAV